MGLMGNLKHNGTITFSAALVKSLAADVGFTACGIARAESLSDSEFPLREWLSHGLHADMGYMQRNAEMRQDPRLLVEGARSIISLLVAYKPDRRMEGPVRIAQYAYGTDYHERLKQMLYSLMQRIAGAYEGFEGRPFVDTAPISDRHWAARAGLGWIGHNTLLVNPQWGSYCFIGELVTTAEADCYDSPSPDGCGDCRRCVDACPNGAIVRMEGAGSFQVDARRCTSYNTIENRNPSLPPSLVRRGYTFGCDICQLACPYNEQAPAATTLDDERKQLLEQLPDADKGAFRRFTKHSPLNRITYEQWLRNIGRGEPNGDPKTKTEE